MHRKVLLNCNKLSCLYLFISFLILTLKKQVGNPIESANFPRKICGKPPSVLRSVPTFMAELYGIVLFKS